MGNKPARAVTPTERAGQRILARETELRAEMFDLRVIAHHGLPSNTKSIALCSLQGILAVGTANGRIKFYGQGGLEVAVDAPPAMSAAAMTISVTHMQFTAHQRLAVAYSDSSIRIFDLTTPDRAFCEVPSSWTTSEIKCMEAITYADCPYVLVALGDGTVRVVHEDTAQVSTYTISTDDLGLSALEDDRHAVLAMASNPRDANQLLLACESTSSVFLWDVSKRKLAREYTLTKSTAASTAGDPLSLSWHASGKKFVAGFTGGGIAVYRVDKNHARYRHLVDPPTEGDDANQLAPVRQVQWICAPPNSRHASLAGAVVMIGGCMRTELHGVTLLHPPPGMDDEDALTSLAKNENLTWSRFSIYSTNGAPMLNFAVSNDQVDFCAKLAPFSLLLLSGDPLEGCAPALSVECLPCFVRLREGDKEAWEWDATRVPPSCSLPPPLLQSSSISAMLVATTTDRLLRDDLVAALDPQFSGTTQHLSTLGDFEWPINGGQVCEPLQKQLATGAAIARTATLLLTGHANGTVLFWELGTPSDQSSKGTIELIHAIDVVRYRTIVDTDADASTQDQDHEHAPVTSISRLEFCAESRTLVVGFADGQIVVLEYFECGDDIKKAVEDPLAAETLDQQSPPPAPTEATTEECADAQVQAGFRLVFALHIHSSRIQVLSLASGYGYLAVADASNVVSLVNVTTQQFDLLIMDIAVDEPASVDSLLLSELVQASDVPFTWSTIQRDVPLSMPRSRDDSTGRRLPNMRHCEVVPVLFVGRGNGTIEMFHVLSAKRMCVSVVDPHRLSSVSTVLMIDSNGHQVRPRARRWTDEPLRKTETDLSTDGWKQQCHLEIAPDDLRTTLTALQESAMAMADAGVMLPSTTMTSSPADIVEAQVPPGSMGLHLDTESKRYAIVQDFVADNATAVALASAGVRHGHAIVAINGVDMTPYSRELVCSVLDKLRASAKVIVFGQGLDDADDSVDIAPRLLICMCGSTLHLVPIELPTAAELASGITSNKSNSSGTNEGTSNSTTSQVNEDSAIPPQPVASAKLATSAHCLSLVDVPIHDHTETCLVVIDLCQNVYAISLRSMQLIWNTDSSATLMDGMHIGVSSMGELLVVHGTGEVERLSLFADATASEAAMLAQKSVQTRLHQADRTYAFVRKDSNSSPKKKSGMEMLKKLVSSSSGKDVDLSRVFLFSVQEDERAQLLGDRGRARSASASPAKRDAVSASEQTSEGLGATKHALAQATQHLHERGERLGDLAVKTERMKDTAEDFYRTMKAFNDKNSTRKWYDF